MSTRLALIAAMAVAILTTGCATVSGSTNQTVAVVAKDQKGDEVADAKCELNNDKGRWYLTTPGSTMVHRSNEDLRIVCKKIGHETVNKAVVSDTKGSMYGNIILGGGVGALIDHSNGSAYEYPAIVQVAMRTLTQEEMAALAAQAAQQPAPTVTTPAASAAAGSRTMVPLAIASGRKPQQGDEWEYLASDKLFGKTKKVVWRVKGVESGGVVEELLVDGSPSYNGMFNGQPQAIAAPIDMGFVIGPQWDSQVRMPELQVKGDVGDCIRSTPCTIDAKVTGLERITIAAGTFDAVRIDGDIILKQIAIQPRGRISIWYSERDRRVLKQVASMRNSTRTFDETVELQAARTYQ